MSNNTKYTLRCKIYAKKKLQPHENIANSAKCVICWNVVFTFDGLNKWCQSQNNWLISNKPGNIQKSLNWHSRKSFKSVPIVCFHAIHIK